MNGIRARVALLAIGLAVILLPINAGAQCGVERWSVKTGTDPDAGLVNLSSTTPTTIATMVGWPAPNPIPSNNRVSPYETTVSQLNATLVEYKLESDSDYHLVLSDGNGHTMIAEIPAPSCVGSGSPFLNGITNARNEFDAVYTATGSFQTANIPVRVTGVGMFDFLHGQTGVAPNGIEIHPVLDIVFNPSSTPDFTIAASPTSVSAAQGGSGTTTITTTVSGGFNNAVSLSASGLPTGATATFSPTSIAAPGSGSSTLTLAAASSTTAGSYAVTVTGAGGSTTHTVNVTFTVTSSGGSTGVTNGGFETGNSSGWTTAGTTSVIASAAHTGAYGAQLGSTSPTNGDSSVSQTFTLPSSGSPKVSFWYSNHCPDTVTYDWATATLADNSTGTTATLLANTCSATATWTNVTYDASASAGHSVTLTLTSHDDNYTGDATYTWYDDVIIQTSTATPDFTVTTSPTSVTAKQGASATTTVTTAVSGGFSNAISLSASGLPTGASASFNPTSIAAPGSGNSTLTVTAVASTPTGTYTVTVTATGGGTTHTATVSFAVTSTSTAQQLLGNPGFENGSSSPAPWVASSGAVDNSTAEPAHSGSWKAWLDGYGSTHTDTVYQQVSIPSTVTTATLSFWLHIDTAETTTSSAYDTLRVQIRNSSGTVLATLATYSNLNAASGYTQKSFNVIAYKGQTIQVYLVGSEDSSLQTSFVVDDFALNVQ